MIELRNIAKIIFMYLVWLLYLVRKVLTPVKREEPQRICVLYLSGMGDILCDQYFFEGLRHRFSSALLTGCFPTQFVALQKEFFAFDAYISHSSYIDTLKQINQGRFHLIILPGWLMRNSVIALLSNTRSILGYINDLSFSNRYLNSFKLESVGMNIKAASQDMKHCHLSKRPDLIANALGFNLPQADSLQIIRRFPEENYAVIHTGARFAGRRWPKDRFTELIDQIMTYRLVDTIYLIGDQNDRADNEEITQKTKSQNLVNKAGELDLQQTYNLIARARLFVGNDSGPMHIAALAGVPTLGLMGPNYPQVSGPMGAQSHYLFHQFECSGCNQRSCSYDYRCIKAITVQEAINILKGMCPLE